MTSGFSGADLQSLVSNAQLEAIHDILDAPSEIDETASKNSSGLLPAHLRLWRDKEKGMNSSQKTDLLKQVRASLSRNDQTRPNANIATLSSRWSLCCWLLGDSPRTKKRYLRSGKRCVRKFATTPWALSDNVL